MEDTDRRIVLLGKAGSGKSSLANTIFGDKDLFEVSHKANNETTSCKSKTKSINGKSIQLIDTPGLFDTDPKSTELNPGLLKCVTECAPGPHAFLLVLKVERYTRQEQAVVDVILKYFDEDALKYTTVVFTHGQQMEEGMKIEDWVRENDTLNTLIQKCGGRCHVFDNKSWNGSTDAYRNNQLQVKELLKTIEQTVEKNRGRYYTNEFLQTTANEIHQKVKCLQVSCPEFTFKDILQKAKTVVYSKLMDNMEGALIGVLLGAFLGSAGGVMAVIAVSPGLIQRVSAAVTGAVVWGATGGLFGAFSTAKTPMEAVQNATAFVREVELLANQVNKTRKA